MRKARNLLVRQSDGLPFDITALAYDSAGAATGAAFVLAHGAGAGQHSQFITDAAAALANHGVDVVTFNFPYMERGRRVPDPRPVLEACYRAVIAAVLAEVASARQALFIGGKSMGGRIATQVAAADAALPLAGLVLLGYPLHPPGRPAERRDAHLPAVGRPMLFVQGERDSFGTPSELAPILQSIAPAPVLHEVSGGDHSFKVPASRSRGQTDPRTVIYDVVARWISKITTGDRRESGPLRP